MKLKCPEPGKTCLDATETSEYRLQFTCRDAYGSSDTQNLTVLVIKPQTPTQDTGKAKIKKYPYLGLLTLLNLLVKPRFFFEVFWTKI